jgi:hypothetical protein
MLQYTHESKWLAFNTKEIKMTYQEMINMKVLCLREQIQEDLITLLDYAGISKHEDEVKNAACQIVVDRFAQLLPLLQSDVQVRAFCNNSLTTNKTE